MPTVKELQAQARERNIGFYSTLRKDELINLLNRSPKRRSPKRRSPKRRSPKRRSPKRRSPKKSPKRSPNRRSPKKSPNRRSPKKSPKRRSPKKSPKRMSPKKSPKRMSQKRGVVSAEKNIINSSKWYIFTMEGCGYCTKAKELLTQHNQTFNSNEITKYNEKSIYAMIDPMTNKYRYFPIIFHKGKFLGGYQELSKILK